MTKKGTFRWGLLAGIVLLLIGGLTFLKSESPVTVKTSRVQTGTVEERVTAAEVGTIEPVRRATLSAEIQGIVTHIPCREGALVRQEAVLIQINPKDLLMEKQRLLKEMETTCLRIFQSLLHRVNIQKDMARLESLRKSEIVSQQQYERLQSDLSVAQKEVEILIASAEQIDATLHQVDLNLDKTLIRAPFDSVISKLMVEEGETVAPSKMLITLVDSAPPYVEALVDEVDLGRVRLGQEVRITFDALPDKTFAGEMMEIAPVATTDQKKSRTIKTKTHLREWSPELRIGLSAKVVIITRPGKSTRVIPTNLIYPQKYVYVVERGHARKRFITTGMENWELTEIVSGLSDQDEIIIPLATEDEKPIQDGTPVTVQTPQ